MATRIRCATCGKSIAVTGRSLPEGKARCRECRRADFDPDKFLGRYAHGGSAYQKGCRCEICRAVKSEALKRYRAGR